MAASSSTISIKAFLPTSRLGRFISIFSSLFDRLLGLSKLQQLYLQHGFSGLDKQRFSLKLLSILGITFKGDQTLLSKIPSKGRFIVVCNHPYGMIEGVAIAYLLSTIRPDTKVVANVGLKILKELQDYFIFTNPLNSKSVINQQALKSCFAHLENDGLLVIFPAGRVSTYQDNENEITDAPWNRLSASLAIKTKSPVLPVFISGQNSKLFHQLGRIYFRLRLLMLVRELLKLKNHCIEFSANNPITPDQYHHFKSPQHLNDFFRLQCYLNQHKTEPPTQSLKSKPLISEVNGDLILDEILQLDQTQTLLNYHHFTVYYSEYEQIPQTLREITRLRELTFRLLNEGSGEECDSDEFDKTYIQLFVFDHKEKKIVGAYRIGRTDKLLKSADKSALYLSNVFQFDKTAFNIKHPCLELGRSFINPDYQKSFYGLLLLWRGICTFAFKHPQYRTLYGTVSLSTHYHPLSITLISKALNKKSSFVKARVPYQHINNTELDNYFNKYKVDITQLSLLIQAVEKDRKTLPILAKHYHKMGAEFHCLGLDAHFNNTPGLLLRVDLPKSPDKLLNLYFGKENKKAYLEYAKKT